MTDKQSERLAMAVVAVALTILAAVMFWGIGLLVRSDAPIWTGGI